MSEIALSRGVVALVDDEDFPALARFGWFAVRWRGHYYAARHEAATRKAILMHRVILQAPPGARVDHRRHLPLALKVVDNRKANLRLATERQNQQNGSKHQSRPTHSIFKGVTLHRRNGKWKAQIRIGGRQTSLGYFILEVHAALAYDLAAARHFGEFALTNFPVPGSTNCIF